MGHKSKFTFPVPHRKPKEPPSISAPLTKVQKILGTGEVNIDSLTIPNRESRRWDTGSAGGISISVSESSASQPTNGHFTENSGRRNFDSLSWEQESAIIPRILQSHYSSNGKILNVKKSTGAFSADYLDVKTDTSAVRRQHSSSTIHTYYEKANMPLHISQQTSNSVIARGLPAKAKALLDVEGAHLTRADSKRRKKPPKLDFLMLSGKHRRQQKQQQQQQQQAQHHFQSPEVEPVLGNNYVTRSPSLVSVNLESEQSNHSMYRSPERTKQLPSTDANAPSLSSFGPNRLRAAGDTTRQLYDHYEQMLAKDEPDFDQPESPLESTICGGSSPLASPPFFVALAAPSKPVVREPREYQTHIRKPSKESEISTFSGLDASLQLLDPAVTKKDYASSISSRYTRTSKASRTDKSIFESDRHMTSVLSLSDSESDEDAVQSASRSSPFSQRSFPEELHTATPNRRPNSSRLPFSEPPRTAHRGQGPDYAQLKDCLAIPQAASKLESGRIRSSSTVHSNDSSRNTVVLFQSSSPLQPPCFSDLPLRAADRDSVGSQHNQLRDSNITIRESMAIYLRPLISSGETPTWAPSTEEASSQLHIKTPPQRSESSATRTSHYSRTSDQPTPPMSPLSTKSVEIYLQSPEPMQKDPAVSNTEPDKSRFMAVTKQEEMLLAALRQKRALMRENTGDGGGNEGSPQREDMARRSPSRTAPAQQQQNVGPTLEVPRASPGGPRQPPKPVPERRSSLMVGGRVDESDRRLAQEQSRVLRDMGGAGARPNSARDRSTLAENVPGMIATESKTRAKAPRDRVLMYLEHPPRPTPQEQDQGGVSKPGQSPTESMGADSSSDEGYRYERQRREESPQSRTASSLGERGYLATDGRDEPHRQRPEQRARPSSISWNNSDSNYDDSGSGMAAAETRARQLQRVLEDDRETDDDPDGDSDVESDSECDDDDDDDIIDFDAFPTPASYQNQNIFGAGASGHQPQTWKQQQQQEEAEQGYGQQKDYKRGKGVENSVTWPMSPPQAVQSQKSDVPSSHGTPSSVRSSSIGHIRGKKSGVRLSAVGRKNSLLPWLGDED